MAQLFIITGATSEANPVGSEVATSVDEFSPAIVGIEIDVDVDVVVDGVSSAIVVGLGVDEVVCDTCSKDWSFVNPSSVDDADEHATTNAVHNRVTTTRVVRSFTAAETVRAAR